MQLQTILGLALAATALAGPVPTHDDPNDPIIVLGKPKTSFTVRPFPPKDKRDAEADPVIVLGKPKTRLELKPDPKDKRDAEPVVLDTLPIVQLGKDAKVSEIKGFGTTSFLAKRFEELERNRLISDALQKRSEDVSAIENVLEKRQENCAPLTLAPETISAVRQSAKDVAIAINAIGVLGTSFDGLAKLLGTVFGGGRTLAESAEPMTREAFTLFFQFLTAFLTGGINVGGN